MLIRIAIILLCLSLTFPAFAACTRPDGVEGELVYNKDQKIMQYCDGDRWVGIGSKRGSRTVTGNLNVTGILSTPYARYGFYNYKNAGIHETGYVHLKTNQSMHATIMQTVEFKGYEYNASKTISAQISYYPWPASSTTAPIYVNSTGTHAITTYYSADKFVVLTIPVAHYHLGFVLNQYAPNPQGLFPLQITATAFTSSATGAF